MWPKADLENPINSSIRTSALGKSGHSGVKPKIVSIYRLASVRYAPKPAAQVLEFGAY